MKALQCPGPKAEQLLSEYGLGQAKAEYTDQMLKAGLLALIFVPLGLLFIALIVPPLLSPSFLVSGNWLENLGNLLPALLWGSCFSLLGLFCTIFLVMALLRGTQHVYLGEKGFLSAHRHLETIARWEDVREIRRRLFFVKNKTNRLQRVALSSIYRIIPAEGKPCTLSADPGPAIELAVTACQLPHALENYAAGNLLSFGWLELNLEGLHLRPGMPAGDDLATQMKRSGRFSSPHKLLGVCIESGERFLAWEHLACAWIDESRSTLVLSKKGVRQHWAIVPLYQVPNSALCLALIEHASSHTAQEIA